MSKIIRKIRQEKKKARDSRGYTNLSYPAVDGAATGKIVDFVHERGRGAPYAVVEIHGVEHKIAATEGTAVGKEFSIGDEAPIRNGNILKLKNIPEGTAVHSVEYKYNDGGMAAMTAGAFCLIVNHRKETGQSVLKMPSGIKKLVSSEGRAIVGIVASGGMKDKPILKAGNAHFLHKSRGQLFPRVRGVAMNPVDHQHGGGNHQHIGFPCTISRRAPYAQQVGLVAARRTGRRTGSRTNK